MLGVMGRLLPLVVIAALAGLAAPAAADGFYFTESFGGTRIKDEVAAKLGDGGFRLKVGLGYRGGRWAVEGWFASDMADGAPDRRQFDQPQLVQVGLDLRHLWPVSRHVDIYLRGSMSHGALDTGDYAGRGLGVGAGIQLKGRVPVAGLLFWPLFFTNWGPKMTAAVFVDDGYEFLRLHPGGDLGATPAIDAQLTHLTMGFALGSDF